VLFSIFITIFFLCLYTVYPRVSGMTLPQVAAFNVPSTAVHSMMLLALLGEPSNMQLEPDGLAELGFWQLVNMAVFVLFYVACNHCRRLKPWNSILACGLISCWSCRVG
jgi:hypothetical protein